MKIDNYIKEQNLNDSLINKKFLYQVRPDLPERKEVGTTKDGLRIFFEETQGSLLKRHYKYIDSEHATSWNLIYIDENGQAKKVNKTWLRQQKIVFNNDFDIEILTNYLKNNSRRFDGLNGKRTEKKRRVMFLTDEEYNYVIKFVEKMRGIKNENN